MGRGALSSFADVAVAAGAVDEAPDSTEAAVKAVAEAVAEAVAKAIAQSAFPSFKKARETASAPSSARAFPAAA